jgi:hypothetical protein
MKISFPGNDAFGFFYITLVLLVTTQTLVKLTIGQSASTPPGFFLSLENLKNILYSERQNIYQQQWIPPSSR